MNHYLPILVATATYHLTMHRKPNAYLTLSLSLSLSLCRLANLETTSSFLECTRGLWESTSASKRSLRDHEFKGLWETTSSFLGMQLILPSASVYTAEEEAETRKRIGANAKLTISQEIKDDPATWKHGWSKHGFSRIPSNSNMVIIHILVICYLRGVLMVLCLNHVYSNHVFTWPDDTWLCARGHADSRSRTDSGVQGCGVWGCGVWGWGPRDEKTFGWLFIGFPWDCVFLGFHCGSSHYCKACSEVVFLHCLVVSSVSLFVCLCNAKCTCLYNYVKNIRAGAKCFVLLLKCCSTVAYTLLKTSGQPSPPVHACRPLGGRGEAESRC